MPQTTPLTTDALSSWKEIAAYLKCSVRSAQRYRRISGLPVSRLGSGPRGRVIAFPKDLDWWLAKRSRKVSVGNLAEQEIVTTDWTQERRALERFMYLLRQVDNSARQLKGAVEQSKQSRFSIRTGHSVFAKYGLNPIGRSRASGKEFAVER